MPVEAMSIIEVARRLQDPDLCPVCRQDWRHAGCSHQGLYLDGLCSEDIDALCENVEYFQACDAFLKGLIRCLQKR